MTVKTERITIIKREYQNWEDWIDQVTNVLYSVCFLKPQLKVVSHS